MSHFKKRKIPYFDPQQKLLWTFLLLGPTSTAWPMHVINEKEDSNTETTILKLICPTRRDKLEQFVQHKKSPLSLFTLVILRISVSGSTIFI